MTNNGPDDPPRAYGSGDPPRAWGQDNPPGSSSKGRHDTAGQDNPEKTGHEPEKQKPLKRLHGNLRKGD